MPVTGVLCVWCVCAVRICSVKERVGVLQSALTTAFDGCCQFLQDTCKVCDVYDKIGLLSPCFFLAGLATQL